MKNYTINALFRLFLLLAPLTAHACDNDRALTALYTFLAIPQQKLPDNASLDETLPYVLQEKMRNQHATHDCVTVSGLIKRIAPKVLTHNPNELTQTTTDGLAILIRLIKDDCPGCVVTYLKKAQQAQTSDVPHMCSACNATYNDDQHEQLSQALKKSSLLINVLIEKRAHLI